MWIYAVVCAMAYISKMLKNPEMLPCSFFVVKLYINTKLLTSELFNYVNDVTFIIDRPHNF